MPSKFKDSHCSRDINYFFFSSGSINLMIFHGGKMPTILLHALFIKIINFQSKTLALIVGYSFHYRELVARHLDSSKELNSGCDC